MKAGGCSQTVNLNKTAQPIWRLPYSADIRTPKMQISAKSPKRFI